MVPVTVGLMRVRASCLGARRPARGAGAVAALLLLLVAAPASVASHQARYQEESLRGLESVLVLVEEMDPAAELVGIRQDVVRMLVELKLDLAGIEAQEDRSRFGGVLYVNLHVVELPPGSYMYVLRVELLQSVILLRDPRRGLLVTTWEDGVVGHATSATKLAEGVGAALRDLVDGFVNDYLAVNGGPMG